MDIKQEDDGKKGRFVIYDSEVYAGEMTYVWAGDAKFIIDHTAVEQSFNGKGLGKMLVMEAIKFARKNNFKILPLCPYAKSVFEKNPELNDVKA
ncbi:MAG: N-acetyltransferase [Bacteroidetes bacterium]|nr:N-acetyltransferase [Bacteroidota bacterium]